MNAHMLFPPAQVVAAVYGRFHHIDPRFGLWLQAVEGTITQQATRASRLWPRLHDQKMAPQKGTAVLKDLQGTTQRSPPGDASNPGQVWWTNPFDEDDDGVELEEALDRQVKWFQACAFRVISHASSRKLSPAETSVPLMPFCAACT
eukprot:scaffold86298_cov30-Tisochrysis_lutea.AAC.3